MFDKKELYLLMVAFELYWKRRKYLERVEKPITDILTKLWF